MVLKCSVANPWHYLERLRWEYAGCMEHDHEETQPRSLCLLQFSAVQGGAALLCPVFPGTMLPLHWPKATRTGGEIFKTMNQNERITTEYFPFLHYLCFLLTIMENCLTDSQACKGGLQSHAVPLPPAPTVIQILLLLSSISLLLEAVMSSCSSIQRACPWIWGEKHEISEDVSASLQKSYMKYSFSHLTSCYTTPKWLSVILEARMMHI